MADRIFSIGRLKQRVTWQKQTSGPATDGTCGQDVTTWPVQGTIWAEVAPVAGSEVFNAEQLKSLRPQRITIRFIPGITAGDQLIFEGRTLTITSVERDRERNIWLVLTAVEQAQNVAGGP